MNKQAKQATAHALCSLHSTNDRCKHAARKTGWISLVSLHRAFHAGLAWAHFSGPTAEGCASGARPSPRWRFSSPRRSGPSRFGTSATFVCVLFGCCCCFFFVFFFVDFVRESNGGRFLPSAKPSSHCDMVLLTLHRSPETLANNIACGRANEKTWLLCRAMSVEAQVPTTHIPCHKKLRG